MNDNELCDKSTGDADICAGLRTNCGQPEPVEADIQKPLRGRSGIIDLLAKVGGSLPELDPPITEASSQTPETDAATYRGWGDFKMATEPEVARRLERERNEARRLFESSKRARKSLSEACDLLQRQLAETRKQVEWKQYRVEVLQRVGRKIVAERDDALDALAKQLNYANDMREQRDKLVKFLCKAASVLPVCLLKSQTLAAIASVEGGGK